MNIKRDNPLCFAIYEEDSECMSCRMVGNFNGYECTALKNNEGYEDECPFFVPMCKHRINNKDGFFFCKAGHRPFNKDGVVLGAPECCGVDCPDYERKEA